jgi:hypothetical protein
MAGTALLRGTILQAAPENVGTTAATFLAIETGARPLGMGGAFTAVSGGAEQLGWNPAAITGSPELCATHARLYGGAFQHHSVAFASGLGFAGGRFGLSLAALTAGSIEGRDATGAPTEDVGNSSAVLGFSWTQSLGSNLALGGTVKAAREAIGEASGLGVAADVGVRARNRLVGVAALAQNLGPEFEFDGTRAPLPRTFRVGTALFLLDEAWTTAADLDLPYDGAAGLRAGMEFRVHPVLTLRGGYRLDLNAAEDDSHAAMSVGAGTAIGGLQLDYAMVHDPDLAASHRASVGYRFASPTSPPRSR